MTVLIRCLALLVLMAICTQMAVCMAWDFEPSGRLAWQAWRNLTPSIEYYGYMGPVGNLFPLGQQIHLIFPGADWKIGERLTWSFGVGLGMTGTGSQVILKSRIEFEFGRKHN